MQFTFLLIKLISFVVLSFVMCFNFVCMQILSFLSQGATEYRDLPTPNSTPLFGRKNKSNHSTVSFCS